MFFAVIITETNLTFCQNKKQITKILLVFHNLSTETFVITIFFYVFHVKFNETKLIFLLKIEQL